MILQALTQLYEDLAERGEISRPGWAPTKISFALCLDNDGNLTQVIPTLEETVRGKKTVLAPQSMTLPVIGTRSGKVTKPGFLWDNASYLLGIDDEEYLERTQNRFRSCKELHCNLLADIEHPSARAILALFGHWDASKAKECPALQDCWDGLLKGANLVFRVDGIYAQQVDEIARTWNHYYNKPSDGIQSQCLISGRYEIPESTHPLIKGVTGAQPSGAALVSFNAPAFCSYGKAQSLNAPVGKHAAFAYTTALNHLLANRENVHHIGDTTVVCWAEGAEPEYDLFANFLCFGDAAPEQITTDDLRSIVSKLAQGLPCEEIPLDLSRHFYILGLAPNAARLSVRFFYNSTFG